MKKAIMHGVERLVSVMSRARDPNQTEPNATPSQTVQESNPDLDLRLANLRVFEDPTLVVNGDLHYFFVRRDGRYQLSSTEPDQKTLLVVSLSDPNHDQTVTMNLGDGRIYDLAYDPEAQNYQISPQ